MAVLTPAVANRTNDAPRVCVIGAGPCGLAAIKNLRDVGLRNIVCYDEGEEIGGNWAFSENTDRTSVYECTHIISSKRLSGFDGYPMPKDYPDYPSHRQLLAYFKNYAAAFDLSGHIKLRTHVRQVDRGADGRWTVRLAGNGTAEAEKAEVFDYLLVCTGHHREAFVPGYPGHFDGETLHSSAYRRSDRFRGQRVLVVGGGNSGSDIAVDVSRVSNVSCLSMRNAAYIVPKLVFGRPLDVVLARARRYIPAPLLQPFLRLMLGAVIGPLKAYGLPQPKHGPLEIHPTLNTKLLEALRSGEVLLRPGIDRLDGRLVQFTDGRREEFDTIIWATGFRASFPFLPSTVVDWSPEQPPHLFLKMMHAVFPNLFFIGLFQPLGCIWALADYQARIAALQIVGKLSRRPDIAERIKQEISNRHWRYAKSPRHLIEVDAYYFREELLREFSYRAP